MAALSWGSSKHLDLQSFHLLQGGDLEKESIFSESSPKTTHQIQDSYPQALPPTYGQPRVCEAPASIHWHWPCTFLQARVPMDPAAPLLPRTGSFSSSCTSSSVSMCTGVHALLQRDCSFSWQHRQPQPHPASNSCIQSSLNMSALILLPVNTPGLGKQAPMFAEMLILAGTSPARRAEGPRRQLDWREPMRLGEASLGLEDTSS